MRICTSHLKGNLLKKGNLRRYSKNFQPPTYRLTKKEEDYFKIINHSPPGNKTNVISNLLKFIKKLPPNTRLVEFGPGLFPMTHYLNIKNSKLLIDADPEIVEILRRAKLNVELGSFTRYLNQQKSSDCILCINSLGGILKEVSDHNNIDDLMQTFSEKPFFLAETYGLEDNYIYDFTKELYLNKNPNLDILPIGYDQHIKIPNHLKEDLKTYFTSNKILSPYLINAFFTSSLHEDDIDIIFDNDYLHQSIKETVSKFTTLPEPISASTIFLKNLSKMAHIKLLTPPKNKNGVPFIAISK